MSLILFRKLLNAVPIAIKHLDPTPNRYPVINADRASTTPRQTDAYSYIPALDLLHKPTYNHQLCMISIPLHQVCPLLSNPAHLQSILVLHHPTPHSFHSVLPSSLTQQLQAMLMPLHQTPHSLGSVLLSNLVHQLMLVILLAHYGPHELLKLIRTNQLSQNLPDQVYLMPGLLPHTPYPQQVLPRSHLNNHLQSQHQPAALPL